MNKNLFTDIGCVSTLNKFKNGTTVIVVPSGKGASITTIGKMGITIDDMPDLPNIPNSQFVQWFGKNENGAIESTYVDSIELREMNFDSPELLGIFHLRKAYDELNTRYKELFKEMEGRTVIQPQLIYISRANGHNNIVQNGDDTIITISDAIKISYNYKQGDRLILSITNVGEYGIDSKGNLEEFYTMYNKNSDSTQSIYEWANENLIKIS